MSRPVCITYDSTCDLTPQLLERFQIRTIPLTIQSGERVFPDNGQYTSAELYAEYRRNGTLPKTAAVSPAGPAPIITMSYILFTFQYRKYARLSSGILYLLFVLITGRRRFQYTF